MARLLTSHDPYHIHAILGILALCHYLWRISKWHMGGIAFSVPPSAWDVLCVTIHGWLPLASLFLHVPNVRNKENPMIWKEFRMHSIIFGLRHVLGCSACMLNLWPKDFAARIAAKWVFIAAAMCAADFATRKLGSSTHRTTNAMPYPASVPADMQLPIKDRYVFAQFGATAMSVYSRDDGYAAFIPLIGIQSSAFCMTLVRKHKLSARGYHLIYSASLVLAGPWTLMWKYVILRDPDHHGPALLAGMFVVMPMRLYCRKIPKELLWLLGVAIIETVYDKSGGFVPARYPWTPLRLLTHGFYDKLYYAGDAAFTLFLLVWYMAPYSILISGPDSRLVRWSRKLHFFSLYTASQNTGVKYEEGKQDHANDEGKENWSLDRNMSNFSEISHSQTQTVSTQIHMRDTSNKVNRE